MKLLGTLIVASVAVCSAQGAVIFYEATISNTVQIDQNGLEVAFGANITSDPINDGLWHFRTNMGYGSDGILVAGNDSDNEVPLLQTTISGLQSGTTYELYGFFRAGKTNPTSNNVWPIRFGMTEDDLTRYNPTDSTSTLIPSGDTSFYEDGVGPTSGSQGLFYVKIGEVVADSSGNIRVFTSNVPGAGGNRTWFEGVGLQAIPEPVSASLSLLGLALLTMGRRRKNV